MQLNMDTQKLSVKSAVGPWCSARKGILIRIVRLLLEPERGSIEMHTEIVRMILDVQSNERSKTFLIQQR